MHTQTVVFRSKKLGTALLLWCWQGRAPSTMGQQSKAAVAHIQCTEAIGALKPSAQCRRICASQCGHGRILDIQFNQRPFLFSTPINCSDLEVHVMYENLYQITKHSGLLLEFV
jgi:hypothetical protein